MQVRYCLFRSVQPDLWSDRNARAARGQKAVFTRRDSYSVILFNDSAKSTLVNDATGSPDQLLGIMLCQQFGGRTNFAAGLREAEDVMEKNWSTERFVA